MFPADAKGIIWENWPLDKVCPCMCVYACTCVRARVWIHKVARTYVCISTS